MRTRLTDAPDWAAEMDALTNRHKGVRYLPGRSGRTPAAIVGDEKVERETLRELVLYLSARLGEQQ